MKYQWCIVVGPWLKKIQTSQKTNSLNYAKKITILGITSSAFIDLIVEKRIKTIKRLTVFMLYLRF